MIQHFSRKIATLSPGRILACVSGGVDSIVLASLLLECKADFAIAHCNFGLRQSAAADEQFVSYWAMNRGITLYKTSFDTRAYASEKGLSLEMAARELRYAFFFRTAVEEGFDYVAVAHNANDNAETLLLNLCRGCSLRGLSGMKETSFLPLPEAQDSAVRLIRPLLWARRSQIEAYAHSHSLLFCTDETNFDPSIKRNSIRLEVFPLLEKQNPSVVRTLSDEAGFFADADAFLRRCAAGAISELVHEDRVELASLLAFGEGWRYLLYIMLEERDFQSATIVALTHLIESYEADPKGVTFSGKRFEGRTIDIQTSPGAFRFVPKGAEDEEDRLEILIPSAGDYLYFTLETLSVSPGEKVDVFSLSSREDLLCGRVLVFDLDAAGGFPLKARHPKDGDRMRPLGLKKGMKKVSDIFTDAKTSPKERRSAWIVSGKKSVAALSGFRIDDRVKVGSTTSTLAIIRLQEEPK